MCSVIGVILSKPTQKNFQEILRVFHESRIRGMHATGISYVKQNKIHTKKLPVKSTDFPFDFPAYVNEDGNLYLIGHCRYSTSDLQYNQPISNHKLSIAHNGVISQEHYERWSTLYGYDCETRNDSELLLRSVEDEKSPLIHWDTASLAVCELYSDKKIRFYRNGKRPLYFTSMPNGYIITSTKDIPGRAGLIDPQTKCQPYTYYDVTEFDLSTSKISSKNKDLQEADYEQISFR
jgi:glutamine phosphoribosylpyrophosphate amidotransferase